MAGKRRTKGFRSISLRVSSREDKALDRLREREGGLSRSAMIRRLIRIEAKSKSLWDVDDLAARAANAKDALFG
jgi:metal-responsive CopG/Arc/MetJ family transcriptional regulator